MAATILVLGCLFDANFIRLRKRLVERSKLGAGVAIKWWPEMEYFHSKEIRVQHGCKDDGTNIELVIVTSRMIGVADALRLSQRNQSEAILVMTATDEQVRYFRREGRIGEHGYAMFHDFVPRYGDFKGAAFVCEPGFGTDVLIDELFFPAAAMEDNMFIEILAPPNIDQLQDGA